MLKNDPPAGTRLRMTRAAQGIPRHATVYLHERGRYREDRPLDTFTVRYNGRLVRVFREDLEGIN